MLLWMGGACVANARRCNRTHCRFTGPFLILMAALVVSNAVALLPLGPYGRDILEASYLPGALSCGGAASAFWECSLSLRRRGL